MLYPLNRLVEDSFFSTPEQFNSEIYAAIKTIIEISIKPIGFTFLSLFALLELVNMSTKIKGSCGMHGFQLLLSLYFKVLLVKPLLDNTL